jgi:predicted RNA binding protein YcfA (HicA-like mRNA interferase family)
MGTKDNRRAVFALAAKYGFVLQREKKHYVFKHPSGRIFCTSKSTLGKRFLRNVESFIKRSLSS